jgi:hypothetical protein
MPVSITSKRNNRLSGEAVSGEAAAGEAASGGEALPCVFAYRA